MEKRSNDLGASKVDMPEQVQEMLASPSTFATTIETIDTHYEYFGTKFTIADEIENVPPANEGSAKVPHLTPHTPSMRDTRGDGNTACAYRKPASSTSFSAAGSHRLLSRPPSH